MDLMLNSFWRASAYCLHPRVIALSLLPLVVVMAVAFGLSYFFWESAQQGLRALLDSWAWLNSFWTWAQSIGMAHLKTVLVQLLIIVAITPLLVILSLIVVAMMMTPAMVSLVAERRFPKLDRRGKVSFAGSLMWSFSATLLAVAVLIFSIPLWFIPPLVLILPPLIWGWLTYRVMSFDALAAHASVSERKTLIKKHRSQLLVIGVISGYLGAAPSLVWASGALFAAAFVILVPLAIWIYTLVFAFASLWFSHYCLDALAQLRAEQAVVDAAKTAPADTHKAFITFDNANGICYTNYT